MKEWTIAYQYNTITFVDACLAHGDEHMDDEDLEQCFSQLTAESAPSGKHIKVVCKRGLRRVVQYTVTHYIYVRAAGGIVSAPHDKHLVIRRNERWDLPKGGVEAGETLQQTAIREVMEETGMHDLTIKRLLAKTYHIYNLYGGWHLKQTSWYAMTVPEPYPTIVQEEEGITEGVWVNHDTLCDYLKHSYATMQALQSIIRHEHEGKMHPAK